MRGPKVPRYRPWAGSRRAGPSARHPTGGRILRAPSRLGRAPTELTSMAGLVCGSTRSAHKGAGRRHRHGRGKYTTLTIPPAEDAFGDMDFKGGRNRRRGDGPPNDTKIAAAADVLAQALSQAREARLKALYVAAIPAPRAEVGENAPKIVSFEVPVDKIGEIMGKVINAIQQETGADVNIDDDGTVGTVTIGAKRHRAVVDEARRRIGLPPPWTRRRLRWSTAAGWSTSPSSGPSSTSSGPTAWSTYRGRPGQEGRAGWRTSSLSDRRSSSC